MARYRRRYPARRGYRKRRRKFGYRTRNVRSGGLMHRELKALDMQAAVQPTPFGWGASDQSLLFNPVGGGTQTHAVNVPLPGTGINNRIGSTIAMKSIRFFGNIIIPSWGPAVSMPQQPNFVIAIVVDKQNNAKPSGVIGDALYSDGLITSARNLDNIDRYHVLTRQVIATPNQAVVGTPGGGDVGVPNLSIPFEIGVKLNGMVTRYDGLTGNGTDIVTNALFFVVACDSTERSPTIEAGCRIRYYD